ncbi:hypothetical protein [Actinoplanes derwentensis]|uniref:hypothetical protein n=1 Tax=Actinoplanes derwentensis TaxID=113562 RepID=UPI0012FD69C2|nr:hypothetical protein [Actinoplanes derwentensis]
MIQTTLPAMLPCQQPTRRLSSHQVVGPTGRSNVDDLLDQLVRLLVCNEVPEEAIAADLVSLGCELLGAASTG